MAYGDGGSGGVPPALSTFWMASADHEGSVTEGWVFQGDDLQPSSIQSGITDAHGRTYFTSGQQGRKDPLANFQSGTFRCRFRPTINSSGDLIETRDTTSLPQCLFRIISDGSFQITRAGTALETSATGLWSIDNWFYVEFKVVIADSGSWVAKIWNDSLTLLATLSGSGDTQNTANAFWNIVEWGVTAADTHIEDISIDTTGGLIDAPSRVIVRYPTGAGNYAAWTRGGTDTGANFSQVNETVKDTVSYVQSNAADQKDSYPISLASLGGTMRALQVNALARAGTAGSRQFKLFLRIGGVDYEGAKTFTVTSTGADTKCSEVWDNDPSTGNAWTGSETVEIGVKSVTTDVRLHHCCAEILVSL